MTVTFLPKNAFPLPTPLTPKLVALGLDGKTAATVSRVYLTSALTLKETCETEYARACDAFIATSDNLGYCSKDLRSKLLTVAVARYMQALSKWVTDAIEKAEASLCRRSKKHVPQPKVKDTTASSPVPGPKGHSKVTPTRENTLAPVRTISIHSPLDSQRSCPFRTITPPHAFPHPYPPTARPAPASLVTSISPSERRAERVPRAPSDCDLDACIAAFARLSLGPPSLKLSPGKPSETVPKSRSRPHTTRTKLASPLSPSRPRLVTPTLDTSVAVPHNALPKHTLPHARPIAAPRTQSIDIPRSTRRKICSIPYRRPAAHLSISPESPSSSHPLTIHRTPSLVSDHGSEASSPSTPSDFSPLSISASVLSKDSFGETSPLEQLLVSHSPWQDIDFGISIYG